jgi:serine/threonine protein kinase
MLQSDINHLSALKKIDNYIYKLEDKIGSGSFSQVFRGTDLNSNTTVAIKKVRVGEIKSKIAGRLLECEISNLKIVKHPNVIRCYDVHSSVNHCYIVMEYC